MNSPNLFPSQRSAPDALFDQLELDMLALTTAALDGDDAAPNQCVDEFSTEFLMQWSVPPG
ncbi:MAG: hypothetical protein ACJ8LG_16365 [Massilia sp.]